MLASLRIRDIVLIEALDLALEPGLCVLTGETGAGKSIILDALGFALGDKADRGLVRAGASQAVVSAAFELDPSHPAHARLRESGIDSASGSLVLRRSMGEDGRSRAFINDEPVTLALLKAVGETLVEVHGQHDDRGLLDPTSHRALLDAFGGLDVEAATLAEAYAAWRTAEAALARHRDEAARAAADADYLAHVTQELAALDPKPGEEAGLAEERLRLGHHEKIAEALDETRTTLARDGGIAARLAQALRRLERASERSQAELASVLAALERALNEVDEAERVLDDVMRALAHDPGRLEAIEARLFALRAAARKHQVHPDALADLHARLAARLEHVTDEAAREGVLAKALEDARRRFEEGARALGDKRRALAASLDAAIAKELKPLKLERATFRTVVETLDLARAGPGGLERVTFLVSTNPGAPPGSLIKVASGGELARFILALKVVLAKGSTATTLVFDEVDRGVGGAVAAAVGERLARLSKNAQVLVVTHSPQVAARGAHHWRIAKSVARKGDATLRTRVEGLDPAARREEIARMLAGSSITDEARAAAERLMADGSPARRRS